MSNSNINTGVTRKHSTSTSEGQSAERWMAFPGELSGGRITFGLTLFAIVLAALMWFKAANGALTAFAILSVPALCALLLRVQEPPALLFACGMQWVQASAAVFYSDFYGLSLEQATGSAEVATATWLSLVGVLVLAAGMRAALVRLGPVVSEKARNEARTVAIPALFFIYIVALAVLLLVRKVAVAVPGLSQPLIACLSLKWVLVFLLGYAVLEGRRHYAILAIVVGLEFVTGLLGYFSSFKGIFFLMVVLVLSTRDAFSPRRLFTISCVAGSLFVCGVVWSAVKIEYRDYISAGSGLQEVVVPVEERVEKLSDLVAGLTWDKLDEGLESMILRVSYVTFFAHTLENVPANVPHENGRLWLGAIKHVVTPRLLFPDKDRIADSERTEFYSGVKVAGEEQGASISIGYIGESYIDFGRYGMFAPIFLLGLFYGGIYRYFVFRTPYKALGFGAACAVLVFGAYNLETSNIKLVGGNIIVTIVTAAFVVFCGPALMRFIKNGSVAGE